MTGTVSTLKRIWIWALVPVVVTAELLMQWRIPRQEPSPADWRAAAAFAQELKQPGDLLVIAPDWAVQARMYFRDWMGFGMFGRFDTTTYTRLIEVSMNGATSPEAAGRQVASTRDFGNLTVNTYPLPRPAEIRYDFVDRWHDAKYQKTGKEPPKLIIDHWFHPRRVLQIGLKQRASVTYDDVPLTGVLRGYAIIGYREGRFGEGAPIRLRIFLNDKKIGERQVANFSKVEPFEYSLPGEGRGAIRFEVTAKDNKKRQFGIAADIRRPGGDR